MILAVILQMLVMPSPPRRVGLHQSRRRGGAQEPVPAADRADASKRPGAFDGEQMSARLELRARRRWETVLDDHAAGLVWTRMERLHHVFGLKHRRIDGLLQAHAVMHETQEYRERPLLLLVAAGRTEREIRLTTTRDEGRRERDARTCAAAQRRRVTVLQPAHLPARR